MAPLDLRDEAQSFVLRQCGVSKVLATISLVIFGTLLFGPGGTKCL